MRSFSGLPGEQVCPRGAIVPIDGGRYPGATGTPSLMSGAAGAASAPGCARAAPSVCHKGEVTMPGPVIVEVYDVPSTAECFSGG